MCYERVSSKTKKKVSRSRKEGIKRKIWGEEWRMDIIQYPVWNFLEIIKLLYLHDYFVSWFRSLKKNQDNQECLLENTWCLGSWWEQNIKGENIREYNESMRLSTPLLVNILILWQQNPKLYHLLISLPPRPQLSIMKLESKSQHGL